MNSEKLLINIYGILNRGIKIWLEDEKIKISVPKDQQLTEQDRSFIESSRQEIIECLIDNNVQSKHYEVLILKLHSHEAALSFAQERLWFLQKYEGESNFYNTPASFKLLNETNPETLCHSIESIVSRHEILRTVIKEDSEGRSYQLVLDKEKSGFKVEISVLQDFEALKNALKQDFNYSFNLSQECPIRARLYKVKNTTSQHYEYYISIVVHHIAFDGWSIDVFLHELEQYYQYYLNKKLGQEAHLNLPVLPIQYKDFALWQRSYLQG